MCASASERILKWYQSLVDYSVPRAVECVRSLPYKYNLVAVNANLQMRVQQACLKAFRVAVEYELKRNTIFSSNIWDMLLDNAIMAKTTCLSITWRKPRMISFGRNGWRMSSWLDDDRVPILRWIPGSVTGVEQRKKCAVISSAVQLVNNYDLWLFLHIVFSVCLVGFALLRELAAMLIVIAWWVLDWCVSAILEPQNLPHSESFFLIWLSFSSPKNASTTMLDRMRHCSFKEWQLQFHRVTISSAPHEKVVTFHIRAGGNWTRRLVDLSSQHGANSTVYIVLLERRYYGNRSMDLNNHRRCPTILLCHSHDVIGSSFVA